MSKYRDDTQETIVLSSFAFGKVTSGAVERVGITEKIFSKIRHNIDEVIHLADSEFSRRIGQLDSDVGFSDQVLHKVRKFQLIEERFGLADHSFVKQRELVTEDLGLCEEDKANYKALHIEPFKLNEVAITYKMAYQGVSDRIKLRDSVNSLSRLSDTVDESFSLSATVREKLKVLIIDTLSLGQQLEQHILVKTQVMESLKFRDNAVQIKRDLVHESFRIADEYQKASQVIDLIVESLAFVDQLSEQRTVRQVAESVLKLMGAPSGLKRGFSQVQELLILEDGCHDGRDVVGAWTATADGWNMSRYHDYAYEELFVIDGRLYGVTASGIEELKQGASVVAAQIKTARLDLGDGALVHPESMILEYSLNGDLSVDVGTTQTGQQRKFNYVLQKEPSEYLTNGRVVFGRGLRGRHFDFTVNIEGSTSYINDMVVNLTKTKRRI